MKDASRVQWPHWWQYEAKQGPLMGRIMSPEEGNDSGSC